MTTATAAKLHSEWPRFCRRAVVTWRGNDFAAQDVVLNLACFKLTGNPVNVAIQQTWSVIRLQRMLYTTQRFAAMVYLQTRVGDKARRAARGACLVRRELCCLAPKGRTKETYCSGDLGSLSINQVKLHSSRRTAVVTRSWQSGMLRQVANRGYGSLSSALRPRSFAPSLSTVSTSSPRVQVCESDEEVEKALKQAQGGSSNWAG